jgi:hypothetical protein
VSKVVDFKPKKKAPAAGKGLGLVPAAIGPLLYEKRGYALVNPLGKATYYADRAETCLGEFVRMRNGIMLSKGDASRWTAVLERAGWQIIKAKLGIFAERVDLSSAVAGK